ncbi:MAG: DUF3566 domain-containing protein [Microbacteriaceae bacterium]
MSSVAEKLQRKSQRPVATKQVRLKLVYVDFWSTVKLSFLIAVSLGIVLVVSTVLIYLVLQSTGVFSKVDALLIDILTEDGFSIGKDLTLGTVAFFSIIVAIVNIIIGTALGAITSLLYNLSVRLTGGILVGFTNN